MPLIKRFRVVPVATVLLLTICSPLSAQTVRGTVVDSATSSPVAAATIELLQQDNQLVAEERSDDRGRFRLRAKGPGEYRIRVHRIGYRAFESVFGARGDTTVVLRLTAVPVELDTLGVRADASEYLQRSGFYSRKEGGVGTFIDPATVDKLAPRAKYVVDIFLHVPGVKVVVPENSGGVRIPQLRSCRTYSARLVPNPASGRVMTAQEREGFPDSYATDLSRFPAVYLDGTKAGLDAFNWIQPTELLAIEVYMGPSQIPLQYGGTDAPCGVILIWTKH